MSGNDRVPFSSGAGVAASPSVKSMCHWRRRARLTGDANDARNSHQIKVGK